MSGPTASERPVALAELVHAGAVEEVLRTCAAFHGVGLAVMDSDGVPVFRCGAEEGGAGGRFHAVPLAPGGRLVVGPCPKDLDAEGCAAHVARLIEGLFAAALARRHEALRHQAALAEAFAELADKAQRLGRAVERIEEADRLKTSFLATMSHELRTPLTSVIGYSEMLLEGLAGTLGREQREYVQIIMEKGDQLLQLITGLLDASRIDAGMLHLRREPVDLGETLGGIVAAMTPLVRRKRLELQVQVAEGTPPVQGDREKLRQVLTHLLGNAIKFTPDGGSVVVHIEAQSDEVRLQVADSGIGIAAEKQARIFEPFFQVDSSSTREYGGTGLGLTLVKSYVEAHGGHVGVESELGRGSAFTVILPAVAGEPAPASPGGEPPRAVAERHQA